MKRLLNFIRIFILLVFCFYADSSNIYFTPNRETDQIIIGLLEKAEESIYIASYTMSWEEMIKQIRLRDDIEIKILLDSEPQCKISSGLLKTDKKSSLFHAKFIVVDGRMVFVGSGNLTEGSLHSHHNNFLLIKDPKVAGFFSRKFISWWEGRVSEEFYEDDKFRIYFSPEADCEGIIKKVLSSAVRSIHFAQYHFTSEEIAKAVIRRRMAGVKVYGILEPSSVEPYSVFYSLYDYGCDMRKSNRAGFLHDKFFIVDEEILITGSYNPTSSARRNTECLMVIKDREIAKEFLKEWTRLWRYYSLSEIDK